MDNKKAKILVVEDDKNLGSLLNEYLNAKNYETELKKDGEEGFDAFKKNEYDLLILDIMMPKTDGLTLAKNIRSFNEEIPIIFLTAKSMKEDTLEGFKAGGDDYITKPFSMEELLLRIDAILKRTKGSKEDKADEDKVRKIGKYSFDHKKRELIAADNSTKKLTSKENDLLLLLSKNRNEVLEREQALKAIWGDDNYFNGRSMDVYITKLRKYLKDDPSIEIITVHGRGFKMLVEEGEEGKR